MRGGGTCAHCVYVASLKKLARQELKKDAGDSIAVILERVQNQVEKDRRKIAKKYQRPNKPSLPKQGSMAEDHDRPGRELTVRLRTRKLKGHL